MGGKIEKTQKEKRPWNIWEKNSTFDISMNNNRQDFFWPYQIPEECVHTKISSGEVYLYKQVWLTYMEKVGSRRQQEHINVHLKKC